MYLRLIQHCHACYGFFFKNKYHSNYIKQRFIYIDIFLTDRKISSVFTLSGKSFQIYFTSIIMTWYIYNRRHSCIGNGTNSLLDHNKIEISLNIKCQYKAVIRVIYLLLYLKKLKTCNAITCINIIISSNFKSCSQYKFTVL